MNRKLVKGLTRLLFGIPAFLVFLSILAPLTEVSGWPRLANRMYLLLAYVCPQIPSHSLWLFGAPTGVSSRSLFLYLAFVVAGLFMFRRHRFLSWRKSLLLLIPIFVDGVTQILGWRESTNLLRVLTGAIGGIGIAGLTIPVWARVDSFSFGKDTLPQILILNRCMATLLLVAFLGTILPYGTAKAQAKITVPEGTRLAVKAQETISSETAKKGQIVRFEVARDVEVRGKVVIKAGALATGEVLRAASKKMIGREGELHVAIRYAAAVDGTQVPLRASLEEKGEETLVLTVVLSVVLCPLFLLMKGEEAVIHAGTEFTVFVDRPVEVAVEQ